MSDVSSTSENVYERRSESLDDIIRMKPPSLCSSQLVIRCVTLNHEPRSLCLLLSIKWRVVFAYLTISILLPYINLTHQSLKHVLQQQH